MFRGKARMIWHRQVQQWHWISAAICLAALLLFSITGITLNHSGALGSTPDITTREGQVPEALLAELLARQDAGREVVPAEVHAWLGDEVGIDSRRGMAEWLGDEVLISAPGA